MGSASATPKRKCIKQQQLQAVETNYDFLNQNHVLKKLVMKRIEYCKMKLPIESSVMLIYSISSLARINASKVIGKDILIIVGDTGGGKSTILNYLAGCS